MDKLDFAELHKEKLSVIFENIDILSNIKESDTQLPPKFFKDINAEVIRDFEDRINILNKNTKFVTKELKKDFKQLRKTQKKQAAALRKKRAKETVIYTLPAALLR